MNAKTTVILAVVVIVAGVLLVVEAPWKDVERERERASAAREALQPKALFEPAIQFDDVVRCEITVPGEAKTALVREGTNWKVSEPIEAPAEAGTVSALVRGALNIRYAEKFEAKAKDAPSRAEAGLEKPAATVKLELADGTARTVYVGGRPPLSSDTYVAVEGDEAIYQVASDLHPTFVKKLADVRSKTLFSYPTGSEVKLAVAGTDGYEMTRSGGEWVLTQPVSAETDKSLATRLVNTLRALRVVDFVDDKDDRLSAYGLDVPTLAIEVTIEKKEAGAKPAAETESEIVDPSEPEPVFETHKLLVGGKAGANRYAKLADRPWIVTLPQTSVDSLTVPLRELRSRKLLRFEKTAVQRIEFEVYGLRETIEKEGEGWKLSSGRPAEPIAVDGLLQALRDLEATEFADRPPLMETALDAPRATVRLTLADTAAAPQTLYVGGPTPSGKMVYARRGDDPSVAVLRAESVEALMFPPVAYHDRQVLRFDRNKVQRLQVVRGDVEFDAMPAGAGWSLTMPVASPADEDAISNVLADLNNLRAAWVVADDSGVTYGLSEPEIRVRVTVAGEPEGAAATEEGVEEVAAGPPAPASRVIELLVKEYDGKPYARRADGELVYELDRTVLNNLRAELVDRRVLEFEPGEIVRVIYVNGERTVELSKSGEKWTCAQDPAVPIDPEKVTKELEALAALRTERFVEYDAADPHQFGLAEATTMTLTLTDGERKSEVLWVSAEGPGDDPYRSKYARRVNSGRIMLLRPDQMSLLNKTIGDFEKK